MQFVLSGIGQVDQAAFVNSVTIKNILEKTHSGVTRNF